MAYEFKNQYAAKIWALAQPKGDKHHHAFAWREEPARLDKYCAAIFGKEAKPDDLFLTISLAGQAQTRYRKAALDSNKRLPRPKGIAVWMNAGAWGEEIESHAALKDGGDKSKCACGQPVYKSYSICRKCDDKYRGGLDNEVRQSLKDKGIFKEGDSFKKVVQASKDYLKQFAGILPDNLKKELEK